MQNIRVGDRVCFIHHMSNRGIITELFFRPVTAGSSDGSFSKQMWVRFKSELTNEIVTAKRQDLMKES